MSNAETAGRRKVDVRIPQLIGPWHVVLGWPDDEDQIGPVSIEISPADDATDADLLGGLTSTVLRQIDFRRAREEWLRVRALADKSGQQVTVIARRSDEALRGRGVYMREILAREGVSEGYLGYLAEAYVMLVRNGERSIASKLAEATGRSPDTMRQHLHKVRKAGMLTSIPGKAGGRLTAKAIMAVWQSTEGMSSDDSEAQWELAERLAAEHG
jgi:DNA-binding transcriptional ArsR family regulator